MGWAGQGQVIVKPATYDDVTHVEGVAKEQTGQAECAGGNTKDKEHIGQLPTANGWEAVKEDDPNGEVDGVI